MLGTGRGPLRRRDRIIHRHRLERVGGALAPIARLLVLGDEVEHGELETALGSGAALLVELGLARERGTTVRSAVRLVPHDDLLVAADRAESGTGSEHVAGVHGPSATLAHLTVRRAVSRALDVGTGNGIQALLLARHAERVVATDVNERALAFADFNAALNLVENVELRVGSFLEPVAGERFGVAVANPPYVVSPESALLFRDSGLPGDTVSSELVAAFPSALEEGGFGTVMVSWVQSGDDLAARPRTWLDGECDAWILHTSTADALSSAAEWNRDQPEGDAFAAAVDRWLAYYEREAIEALAYGAIVLRRRPGARTWVRSTELPGTPVSPASDQLQAMFANQDALRGLDDAALLAKHVAVAPSARLVQTVQSTSDGWQTLDAELARVDGLGFHGHLEGVTLLVTLELDGTASLREVLARVSVEAGQDLQAVTPVGIELVRRAIELGLAELR